MDSRLENMKLDIINKKGVSVQKVHNKKVEHL